MIRERLYLTLINIFFPPLTILIITGTPGPDFLLNVFFLLCGVLPGHIHGFYISCTYFHRKGKVRKGIYPGGGKSMIFSSTICNGGISDRRAGELLRRERGDGTEELKRGGTGKRRSGRGSVRY